MYVMSYFRTSAEGLHLAISEDGLAWTPLNGNRPILAESPDLGTIRDPHVSRDGDDIFHLVFTSGWAADGIGHCASRDLLRWGEQEFLPVMAGVHGVRNCWAPECFHDQEDGVSRILWSSTINPDDAPGWTTSDVWARSHDHRIWHTTTRDFRTFEPASVFFDPGYSVIDATLAQYHGRYLMAFKDERGENRRGTEHKRIHICSANRATGPWKEISAPITGELTEGPALFRREGAWVLFYDYFHEGSYGAATSADGRQWSDITREVTFPPGPRHASVIEVDEEVARGLRHAV